MKDGKHEYENVQLVQPWRRNQWYLVLKKQFVNRSQKDHSHIVKENFLFFFFFCYDNSCILFTCLEQWSPVSAGARERRHETSSSYHSNFLLSYGSSPLLAFSVTSLLQGSMIVAYFSAMHIVEIGCVPTVMSRDMKPSSINSTG